MKYGWGFDLVHEPLLGSICSEKLCAEQGDQHGPLPGRGAQALSTHHHQCMLHHGVQQNPKNLEFMVEGDWWPLAECLLAVYSLPRLRLQHGLRRAKLQARQGLPIPEHSGGQQHFKTCLRGAGEEGTGCKLLAERNGCLDTKPSCIRLKWILM